MIFSVKKQTLPQGIEHLKAELSNELEVLQLDIELIDAMKNILSNQTD